MKRSIGLIANLVLLAIVGLVYTRLPDQIPSHWDMQGNVDDTMPRFPGAFLPSLMGVALWFLLPVLRRIDPRRKGYERFDGTFHLVVNAVALVMAVIQGLTLAVSLGMKVDMVRSLLLAVGVMFMVLGNYMPRMRSNWWMGIRTPWTLENEEVWRRTHRLGGRMFFVAGLVTVAAQLLPVEAASIVATVAMTTAAIVPAGYSYFAWRSLRESPHA